MLFPVAHFGAESCLFVIQETGFGALSHIEHFWGEVCLLKVQVAGLGHTFSYGAFLGLRLLSWGSRHWIWHAFSCGVFCRVSAFLLFERLKLPCLMICFRERHNLFCFQEAGHIFLCGTF